MMQCTNHPDMPALCRCTGCAESFCSDCLVEIRGQHYCGQCKVMALQGQPSGVAPTVPCKEAGEALTYAIVGLFCFGIILEPVAIAKALKAKKMIEQNPNLSGSGKATAGLVIAIVGFVLWALGMIVRFSSM